MISFSLKSEFIELYKLLKATGVVESGSDAKHAIAEGRVKVNGEVELRKAFKVRPDSRIEFEGEVISVCL